MSKQKQVTFDIAKMAVYNDSKKIARVGWDKGVHLEKGTVWFFMMTTIDNKIITYIPTNEDIFAKDWIILD